MKKAFIVCSLALFLAACGGGSGSEQNSAATESSTEASGGTNSENPPMIPTGVKGNSMLRMCTLVPRWTKRWQIRVKK